jgi:hypothetical protein
MNKLHGNTSLHELIWICFNFKIDYIKWFFRIDVVYYFSYKLQDPIFFRMIIKWMIGQVKIFAWKVEQ